MRTRVVLGNAGREIGVIIKHNDRFYAVTCTDDGLYQQTFDGWIEATTWITGIHP